MNRMEGVSLPLSALRLLVPPIRLVSAAIWQTVQHKVVADYGMLEEFVSMVTDIVPELLTARQRAQLVLGLRARLILELCQVEADLELLQPHLDRVQTLVEEWVTEAGAANMDVPHSEFLDLVRNLLENPYKREQFFQKAFPEEFGSTYDEALQALMWMFLSRLERFLPLQTFQQVSSMFGEVSSVLEECMDSVCQCEELKTLLQYQKGLSQLNHNDDSLDGACIISALKLPSVERTETDKTQPQANVLVSCTSDLERESLTVPHKAQFKTNTTTEDQVIQTKVEETYYAIGVNGTAVFCGEMIGHEENIDLLQSEVEDTSPPLKECIVQVKRLDVPPPLHSRHLRRNRGLRMKKILLEEKRSLQERALSEDSDIEDSSSFMAPINDSSDGDSWSYYSDEESCHKAMSRSPSVADSWSNYSSDESFVAPVRSAAEDDSLSDCSDVDPSFAGPKILSAPRRQQSTSDIKASTPKTPHKGVCFICQEPMSTSVRSHMKTHFPSGDYACPRCDSRFKLYSSLRLHLKRVCFEYIQQQVDPEKLDEAKNLYKCDKCEEVFRYKVSLEKHKLTHNELYCGVCRKVLRDAATLARHNASHTLFHCTRCEETFTLFKPLLRHCENIHKIARPFKCNQCPKTASKLRNLIAHEWHHTGHLPFQCAQCGLRFRTDADLILHQRVHTRERPYLCAECGKTFSQRSNLLRHLNLIHSESRNEKRHSCAECGKSYKEKGALKKHQRTKHFNELFRHPCPYCGKMVAASTLSRHKLIHTGKWPFKCTVPECDKCFRSTSEVKRHVLMHHTAERPYKCDTCGRGFIRMCYLNAHAKIHSGEKPFVCHICGKAFLKIYSMERHKRLVHTTVA